MSEDIVARLRLWSDNAKEQDAMDVVVGLCAAADEIERLRAELVRTQKIACDNFARRATVNASKRARWFAEQMKWQCFKEESR
jgi:hypothetical protein